MKKNIGSIDKAIRVVIAVVILALGLTKVLTGTWAIVSYVLAAILVLTTFISFCPIYFPFGISTINKKD
jgi:hypothetical protein